MSNRRRPCIEPCISCSIKLAPLPLERRALNAHFNHLYCVLDDLSGQGLGGGQKLACKDCDNAIVAGCL